MRKKSINAASKKLEAYYAQFPDWYWKNGLHDAAILSVCELELAPDRKEKYPKRNCLEILLNGKNALFETNSKRISLYTYRKVGNEISQYSSIEPQLKDYWANFQLYNAIFDDCPSAEQLRNVPFVPTRDNSTFTSESSLFHLKKRNCRVIGNNQDDLPEFNKTRGLSFVFWGISTQWRSPELDILTAILNNSVLK